MAEVNIKIDTVKKSCVVTIDGKEIPDVVDGSFHLRDYYGERDGEDGDRFAVSICQAQKDAEHDLTTYTRISASAGGGGRPVPELPGFHWRPDAGRKAAADIARYLED